jgi:hypothetical protein
MNNYDTFAQFKEAAQKQRAEKEAELGYKMLDTDKGRQVCLRQIARKIEQVIDE